MPSWQTTLEKVGDAAGNSGIRTPSPETRNTGVLGAELMTTPSPGEGVMEISAAHAEPANRAATKESGCFMVLWGKELTD